MNQINKIVGAGILLVLFACGGEKNQEGKVILSGELTNAPTGLVLLSEYLDDRTEIIDTVAVNDKGRFEHTLELDKPGFYELNLYNERVVRLALYEDDVHVTYDFQQEESLETEGSWDTEQMAKVDELTRVYQEEINALNTEYYEAMSAKDQDAIRSIQERAMKMEAEHGERVKETIRSMDGSFAALAAIGMLNPRTDFQFLDNLMAQLNERYPNTKTIVSLRQQLEELRALSVGQPAPEIALPNPEGEIVKLSDLKGKYVLIDFWAAWCKPCREENPNVVRLYHQYKDKGFEVFGVSLDRTREAWLGAIEEDGLEWTQVSDLKYFNSEAAATYQINAIPATYMVDPEGKIIAKDLRGISLENKLKELFN